MADKPLGDWWGSFVDEIYHNGPFATEQEIIDEMVCQSVINIGDVESFNIGQADMVDVPIVDGMTIIENAREAACEEVGEAAEDWLDAVTEAQEKELTDTISAAFKAWTEKHGYTPNFFRIENVTTIQPDHPGVVAHMSRCEACKKQIAVYKEGMRKAGEEIQEIIDRPAEE